jgi:hypothetical protein
VKTNSIRLVAMAALAASVAIAAPIMHVHDGSGTLATVDVITGDVNLIGNMGVVMTDIAFDPTGALYGLSFGRLYSIDRSTAAVTLIGNHSVPGGNALVFAADGTLYAAGNSSNSLYTINPSTGASTNLGSMGFAAGGDLAFNGSDFFLASTGGQLVRIDLSNLSNSVAVGSFGVPNVFGLATGDNGILYGVAGTQIFSINTSSGAASNAVNYAGQGLGGAFGQSFFTEAGAPPIDSVPEPSTYALMTGGLAAFLFFRKRRIQ